jgi:isoleucyl-tRNA synthetase
VGFIDQLTNWYIRRCRERFWEKEMTPDQKEAFETLYHVLLETVKVMAPFVPFLSEAIYGLLNIDSSVQSVHLCNYPQADRNFRDLALEKEMRLAQVVVNLGHSLRKEHKLKVRQPLKKALIISSEKEKMEAIRLHQGLIMDELNVHAIACFDDEREFVELKIKPNFRVLGKKVGPLMKEVKAIIEALPHASIERLMGHEPVKIMVADQEIVLTQEDVEIDRSVKEGLVAQSESGVTVVLDTALDQELIDEGIAREIINKINTMRRHEGFEVTDRITMTIDTAAAIEAAYKKHQLHIHNETLIVHVAFGPCDGTEWDINGDVAIIAIKKA